MKSLSKKINFGTAIHATLDLSYNLKKKNRMKKLVFALIAMLLSFGFTQVNAQTAQKKSPQKSEAKMKKDGTPDMRYKENQKGAKKLEPKHLKKDGTPDKRYKENQK